MNVLYLPFLNCKYIALWLFLASTLSALTQAQPALSAPITYDAVSDFSTSQNSSSTWQYGSTDSATSTTFVPYTAYNQGAIPNGNLWATSSWGLIPPFVLRTTSGASQSYLNITQDADVLNLHPGAHGENSVVRWMAPVAGTFKIQGRFQGLSWPGTTTDVTIRSSAASRPLFQSSIGVAGQPQRNDFSFLATVAQGDTIDFMVGYGNGIYFNDSTGLAATITQATYDAVADFSGASNPNGTWRYGYYSPSSGGLFIPYVAHCSGLPATLDSWTYDSSGITVPFVVRNNQNSPQAYCDVIQPSTLLNLHPGPVSGMKSVVRWVAPQDGAYKIEGRFEGLTLSGTTTDVSIRVGNGTAWTSSLNGYGTQVQFAQLISNSQVVQVKAGTTIDFAVGWGDNQNYYSDSTGLMATITPVVTPDSTSGNGLWAEYYDYSAKSNSSALASGGDMTVSSTAGSTLPTFTRTDSQVNFNWGTDAPDSRISPDYFAVRWTGKVLPRYSENYTFTTTTDNGVRLWVNGKKIIDTWASHPTQTDKSTPIALNAGQLYSIQMEYHEDAGTASAQLGWSSPSQSAEIVPQSQLYSTPASLDVFNVKDPQFAGGAKGDGVTDDTAAFVALTNKVNALGGGVRVLVPVGTYLVGTQKMNSTYNFNGNTYRFVGADIMLFKQCSKPIVVEGAGATLRYPDGMRYGSFDSSGNRYNPPQLPFYDASYEAVTGIMVGGRSCASLTITGLELDGNNTHYILGGLWGDAFRQCNSYGLYFDGCSNISVNGVVSHHFGLDGAYVKDYASESTAAHPHVFRNCVFDSNARQAMSWVGGRGLSATGCKFNNTGYDPNIGRNGPGAGLDIEQETGVCREGEFINCEFVHNTQAGVYAGAGLGSQQGETYNLKTATFRGCTFWNFAFFAIQPNYPGMSFYDCNIYGATIGAYSDGNASRTPVFDGCHFEDKVHPVFGAPFAGYYNSVVAFADGSNGLRLKGCTVINNSLGEAVHITSNQANSFRVDDCLIVFGARNTNPYVGISQLQGGSIANTRFLQTYPGPLPGSYIYRSNMNVESNVRVDAANVYWGFGGGPQGLISPTK